MGGEGRPGPAVVVERVSKSFGNGLVVDEASFSVGRGTCFGLLGPNGAGKSTTLKMVYGFLRPQAGTIRIEGIDVARNGREAKHLLGVAPQEDALDPDLDVGQNLLFHARYCGLRGADARGRVARMLELAELEGHRHTPLAELSSGMRRRLVLARALVNRPRVVILDEPTRGLDQESRSRYLAALAAMRETGVSLLLATHELEEARALCDRAAIMEGGRIVHEGAAGQVVQLARSRCLLPELEEAGAC